MVVLEVATIVAVVVRVVALVDVVLVAPAVAAVVAVVVVPVVVFAPVAARWSTRRRTSPASHAAVARYPGGSRCGQRCSEYSGWGTTKVG